MTLQCSDEHTEDVNSGWKQPDVLSTSTQHQMTPSRCNVKGLGSGYVNCKGQIDLVVFSKHSCFCVMNFKLCSHLQATLPIWCLHELFTIATGGNYCGWIQTSWDKCQNSSRRMVSSPTCKWCHHTKETASHVQCDCEILNKLQYCRLGINETRNVNRV
jgi:hypothetical protein